MLGSKTKTNLSKVNSNSSIVSDSNSQFDSSNESEISIEVPAKKRLYTKKYFNKIIDSDEDEMDIKNNVDSEKYGINNKIGKKK